MCTQFSLLILSVFGFSCEPFLSIFRLIVNIISSGRWDRSHTLEASLSSSNARLHNEIVELFNCCHPEWLEYKENSKLPLSIDARNIKQQIKARSRIISFAFFASTFQRRHAKRVFSYSFCFFILQPSNGMEYLSALCLHQLCGKIFLSLPANEKFLATNRLEALC